MQPHDVVLYDVVIAGAGPAGCACALALKGAGLKVALLDKHSFPRDKICGDAIPGRVSKVLHSIDPTFAGELRNFPAKCVTKKATMHYKGRAVTFNWILDAYTCARVDFDNFLFSLVRKHTGTTILENTAVTSVSVVDDIVSLSLNDSTIITTKLVIGADGAHSVIAKQLTGNTLDRHHHIGSVRAYYSGVTVSGSDNVEIYFDKQCLPSYLWIFPLPGSRANVGFGMLSSEISRRRVDIKKVFHEFIQRSPLLREKFASAIPQGKLEGFGLPLGSAVGTLSGSRFMLTGDAASLIDPITGDGIGNAMLSGQLAAMQVRDCFAQNDFSALFMERYDTALMDRLGAELRAHYRAQRIISRFPFLLDVIFLAGRSSFLKKQVQKRL